MGQSLEDSTKKMEEQTITLEKWEKERDGLTASVRVLFVCKSLTELIVP